MVGGAIKRWGCLVVLAAFTLTSVVPSSQAQSALSLPPPGQMVALSPAFNPPVLKGIKVYPDNPLRFDFILDKGDARSTDDQIRIDSIRLIKYFLASLTIPEKDLWVNLSPYEKDRIVPEAFGQTEMGRDLLAQDYLLKQITSSLLYPEGETGKKFWNKIYALAQEKYGTTDIPVDTFNKVWIVPEKAVVYENSKVGAAFVTESRLKVMLESDYLAQEKNAVAETGNETNEIAREVMRAVVIPELERDVNEGKNFARLRQVYQSLILATWYKEKVKSLLSLGYVDQNKTIGVSISNSGEALKIWNQYLEAFSQGVYNFVREERDIYSDEALPRKYFSGGWIGRVQIHVKHEMNFTVDRDFDRLGVDMRVIGQQQWDLSQNEDKGTNAWQILQGNPYAVIAKISDSMRDLLDHCSQRIPDYEVDYFLQHLKDPLGFLVENYIQHEYVEGQNEIYWRVVDARQPDEMISIQLLGLGKYKLPSRLRNKLFDVAEPPWEDIVPKSYRSPASGDGLGVRSIFSYLNQVRGDVSFIDFVQIGWREAGVNEVPDSVKDHYPPGERHITTVNFHIGAGIQDSEGLIIEADSAQEDQERQWNDYLARNDWDQYKELLEIVPFSIREALVNDSVLRLVPLARLSSQRGEVGSLRLFDGQSASLELQIENNLGYQIGRLEDAWQAYMAGADIGFAVTDIITENASDQLVSNSVASNRQYYVPLDDGYWLGFKGTGDFRNDYPSFRNYQGGVWGLFTGDELKKQIQAVEEGFQGGVFTESVGYVDLFKVPENKGGALVDLDDLQLRVKAHIVVSKFLSPHRMQKLPQILRDRQAFEYHQKRLSRALGKQVTFDQLLTRTIMIMAQAEALKVSSERAHLTFSLQDVVIGGQITDVGEIGKRRRNENYVENIESISSLQTFLHNNADLVRGYIEPKEDAGVLIEFYQGNVFALFRLYYSAYLHFLTLPQEQLRRERLFIVPPVEMTWPEGVTDRYSMDNIELIIDQMLADEIRSRHKMNEESASPDPAATGVSEALSDPAPWVSRSEKTGGIDFKSNHITLVTRGADRENKLNFNVDLIAKIRNASGLLPVITAFQPVHDLRLFLNN